VRVAGALPAAAALAPLVAMPCCAPVCFAREVSVLFWFSIVSDTHQRICGVDERVWSHEAVGGQQWPHDIRGLLVHHEASL
jgi:hypothetical protein